MMAKEGPILSFPLGGKSCFQGRTVKFAVGVSNSYSLKRIWGETICKEIRRAAGCPKLDPTPRILSGFSCCCSHGIHGVIVYLPT